MIKTLMRCVREYKKATLLTPFFVSLEVIVECFLPLEISQLINRIQEGCGIGTIVKYGLVLVLLAFVSLAFGVLAGNYCAEAGCGFAKNLRHDLYYKIQDFSFNNVDKFSSSSLVTRMTTDVSNLQMAYMMVIRIAVRCPLMLIVAFVMSVKLGGKLALIFAVVIPLLGFALFKIIGSYSDSIPFLPSFKNVNSSEYIYLMLPYVVTMIVLILTSKHSRAPKAEGIPYDKGTR